MYLQCSFSAFVEMPMQGDVILAQQMKMAEDQT